MKIHHGRNATDNNEVLNNHDVNEYKRSYHFQSQRISSLT